MYTAAEAKIIKAHADIMKRKSTSLLGALIMLGENVVLPNGNDKGIATAATDGINKFYNEAFIAPLTQPETNWLVLHEVVHIALKHILRYPSTSGHDRQVLAAAIDYVDNLVVEEMVAGDTAFAVMPKGGLLDPKFKGWSVEEVYTFLANGQEKQEDGSRPKQQPCQRSADGNSVAVGGKQYSLDAGDNADQHLDPAPAQAGQQGAQDAQGAQGTSTSPSSQPASLEQQIDRALTQGGILAGLRGASTPRAISKATQQDTRRWDEELQEYATAQVNGRGEVCWSRFDRRRVMHEIYLPGSINEALGSIVLALDTSGSINRQQIDRMGSEAALIAKTCNVQELIVLYWDSKVRGEQRFTPDQYDDLVSLMQPKGGGGTRMSSVSKYIEDNGINPELVLVLTDGYIESDVQWNIDVPTVCVTTAKENFRAPGRIIKMGA
jgi:predicted metal-dependent peptidase